MDQKLKSSYFYNKLFIFNFLLFLLAGVNTTQAQVVYREDVTINGINYTVTPELTAIITTGDYSGHVRIPEKIKYKGDRYTVTEIEYGAFNGSKELITIKLPNSIRTMGIRTFEECEKLQYINIPTSLEHIPNSIFFKCAALRKVYIPQNVKSIGEYPFSYCQSLESIEVHPHNEYFKSVDGVLYNKQLTTLIKIPETKTQYTFPESVDQLMPGCFENCRFITHIDLPEKVTMIPQGAFDDCWGLTEIYVHKGISDIRLHAFRKGKNLRAIHVDEANQHYASVDGVLYNHDKTRLIFCPPTKDSITIEPTTQTIAGHAFFRCEKLKNIVLPEQVKRIEDAAFMRCTSLTTVKFLSKDPVTIIGAAFSNIKDHVTIWVPKETLEFYKTSKSLAVNELNYHPY